MHTHPYQQTHTHTYTHTFITRNSVIRCNLIDIDAFFFIFIEVYMY